MSGGDRSLGEAHFLVFFTRIIPLKGSPVGQIIATVSVGSSYPTLKRMWNRKKG